MTWDDHEVENNYADEISEEDSEPDQDPEVFLGRRAAAYRAYYEHMPLSQATLGAARARRTPLPQAYLRQPRRVQRIGYPPVPRGPRIFESNPSV